MKKLSKILTLGLVAISAFTLPNAYAQKGDYLVKYGSSATIYKTSQLQAYKSVLKANIANLYYEIEDGRYVFYNDYIASFASILIQKMNDGTYDPQDFASIQAQAVANVLSSREVTDPTTLLALKSATSPSNTPTPTPSVSTNFIVNVKLGILSQFKYITVYKSEALNTLKAVKFKVKSSTGTYLTDVATNIVESTVSDTDLTNGAIIFTNDSVVNLELLDNSSNVVGTYTLDISKEGNVTLNTK